VATSAADVTVESWRRLSCAERDAVEAEASGLPLPGSGDRDRGPQGELNRRAEGEERGALLPLPGAEGYTDYGDVYWSTFALVIVSGWPSGSSVSVAS
jgi:hypothetical protein